MTIIKVATNKGDININLFDEDAPMTVASFLFLLSKEFYNGVIFHRVIDDFIIQGGDPLGRGTGGPKDKGISSFPYKGKQINYPFPDEFQSRKVFNKQGILAMANSGSNTNGSQFFITHLPTTWLNNKHTIFGEVINNTDQDIVNSIKKGDKIKEITVV
ncbi:MAG: peptidylprolyl isomerase [Candidatus Lokiarchaeota archaeon]|nr:peptidylprolyl isomerase [Candidatus Lokiarchaeota archaeon]